LKDFVNFLEKIFNEKSTLLSKAELTWNRMVTINMLYTNYL